MADYGSDVSTLTSAGALDLDPYFRTITGAECVAQAIARRLTTPLGGLLDDPEYGYDLRALVHAPSGTDTIFEAQSEIEAQCLLDERVSDATVELSVEDEVLTCSVALTLFDDKAFTLVLAVSAVTVEILQGA